VNARLSEGYGLAPREISEEAMLILERHSWPGNVRELENVLERAFALGEGPVILPEHLPAEVRSEPASPVPQKPDLVTLRKNEEEMVRRAVAEAPGRGQEASVPTPLQVRPRWSPREAGGRRGHGGGRGERRRRSVAGEVRCGSGRGP